MKITVLYCTENSLDQIYCSVLYWKFIWPDLLFCTVLDRQTDFQLNYQNNSCSEHSCYWLSWKDTWSFVSVLKYQLICIVIVEMTSSLENGPVLGYSSYSQTEKCDFWLQFHAKNCIVSIASTEFATESWRDDDSRWRICSVCPTKHYVIVCPKHNQL